MDGLFGSAPVEETVNLYSNKSRCLYFRCLALPDYLFLAHTFAVCIVDFRSTSIMLKVWGGRLERSLLKKLVVARTVVHHSK